ncbi:Small acid-soluble spore protein H 2 [Geobacillus stearothermophilus]|uniref:Small acid-soluble spore protein H 2 n=1 Tax=Geobacillus stearothermophilus TaxID=1422 RepID=A0A150MDK5_GEOSE|nr:Small acid-soluble spore protein H 2 [Geobacillus stearothermophilus]KYD22395.1 hypothetical protein B4109_1314 [Geobacillus stearothermophilus]OAO84394.1 Small acid-soluble spore protein H 2 [Geobacillus stearothermophilus]
MELLRAKRIAEAGEIVPVTYEGKRVIIQHVDEGREWRAFILLMSRNASKTYRCACLKSCRRRASCRCFVKGKPMTLLVRI